MAANPIPSPERAPRVSGLYPKVKDKGAAVRAKLRKSRWALNAPVQTRQLPDLFRLCSGAAQCGLLAAIGNHTIGKPRGKRQRAPEWTECMIAADFACELGFTREQMDEALRDAVKRKLILRKCGCGVERAAACISLDHWIYRLHAQAWPDMPNAFIPRDLSGKIEGEEEANSQGTAVPSVLMKPVLMKPGRVRFASGQRYELAEVKVTAIEYQTAAPLVGRLTGDGVLTVLDPPAKAKPAVVTIDASPLATPRSAPGPNPGDGARRPPKRAAYHKKVISASRQAGVAEVFDPIFRKHFHRTLSGDLPLLRLVEAAAGDVPMNYLAAAMAGRSKRSIASPAVVPLIVREFRQAWESGATGTPAAAEARTDPKALAEYRRMARIANLIRKRQGLPEVEYETS